MRARRAEKANRWRVVRRDIPQEYDLLSAAALPKPLTQGELMAAIKAAQAGDNVARDKVIVHNMRLIQYVVRRYAPLARARGLDVEDMAQEGVIALMRAVDTYRKDGGAKWSTYAVRCIGNQIYGYLNKQLGYAAESLDAPLTDGSACTLGDTLAYEDDDIQQVDDDAGRAIIQRIVRQMLAILPDSEYEAIALYYRLDERTRDAPKVTYDTVAQILGKSPRYVQAQLYTARSRLRRTMPREIIDRLLDT